MQLPAIVTRVKPFGFFFEVEGLMLEGFIHISDIGNDYYVYDEQKLRLFGRHRGQVYSCGEKITVILTEVNLITSESRWCMVSSETRSQKPASKKDRSQPSQSKPFIPKSRKKPKNKQQERKRERRKRR
jgi:ribonuclease R